MCDRLTHSRLALLFWGTLLMTNSLSAQLTGTYSVGTGGDYASLTGAGGAFAALNSSGLSGDVTLSILSDLSEDGSVSLDAWAGGYQLTIQPAAATLRTIRFTGSGRPMLYFDGPDRVTIDGRYGGSGRYLRFESSERNYPILHLHDDCQDVSLLYCEFRSDNSNTWTDRGGAVLVDRVQTQGHDRLRVEGCHVTDLSFAQSGSGLDLVYGLKVVSPDGGGERMEGLQLINNEFYDIRRAGFYNREQNGVLDSVYAQGNSFYATGTHPGSDVDYVGYWGLYLGSGSGHCLRGNFLGGTAAHCEGSKMQLDFGSVSRECYLIALGGDATDTYLNRVDSNVVRNLDFEGGSNRGFRFALLYAPHGRYEVGTTHGNYVGDISADATSAATASLTFRPVDWAGNEVYGFDFDGATSARVENNQIGGILLESNSTRDVDFAGINFNNGTDLYAHNNQIGGAPFNLVKQNEGFLYGIRGFSLSRFDVQGNTIGGIRTEDRFAGDVHPIFVQNLDTAIITHNVIGDRSVNALTNPSIRLANASSNTYNAMMIYVLTGSTSATDKFGQINDNEIGGVLVSSGVAWNEMDLYAIRSIGGYGGGFEINRNLIGASTPGVPNFVQHDDGEFVVINPHDSNDTTYLDDNVIHGIHSGGNFQHGMQIFHVQGENGACHYLLRRNVVGDTTLDASTTPDLLFSTQNGSASNVATLFEFVDQYNYGLLEDNVIGGVQVSSDASGNYLEFQALRLINCRDSTVVQRNVFGGRNQPNAFYISADQSGTAEFLYQNFSGSQKALRYEENVFQHITYAGDYDAELQFFRTVNTASDFDHLRILRDTIRQLHIGGSGNTRVYGFFFESNLDSITMDGVQWSDTEISSSYSGERLYGVYLNPNGGEYYHFLRNTFDDIALTNSSNEGSIRFFYLQGGGGREIMLDRNLIRRLRTATTHGSTEIRAIYSVNTHTLTLQNNVILLDNAGGSTGLALYGLYGNRNGGTLNLYHNTIHLDGIESGSDQSACYFRIQSAGTRDIRNNLFSNQRTGGGSHYTMYHNSTGGTLTCDYNLLYVENDAARLVRYSGNQDFAGWQASGFGTNSRTVSPGTNLVDESNGAALTHEGVDWGDASLGVALDFEDESRPEGGGPDMGAYEDPGPVLPWAQLRLSAHQQGAQLRLQVATRLAHWQHLQLEQQVAGGPFEAVRAWADSGQWRLTLQQPGQHRFRVVGRDAQGQAQVSNLVTVHLQASVRTWITPSPEGTRATWGAAPVNAPVQLRCYDAQGRCCFQTATQMTAGTRWEVALPTAQWPAGTYLIEWEQQGQRWHTRWRLAR